MGIAPIVLGQHPKLFQNPKEFRPERFLNDNSSEKFIFSYIPFSAGPRNCMYPDDGVIGLYLVIIICKFFFSSVDHRYWTEIRYVRSKGIGIEGVETF